VLSITGVPSLKGYPSEAVRSCRHRGLASRTALDPDGLIAILRLTSYDQSRQFSKTAAYARYRNRLFLALRQERKKESVR
jgi:hypothetical protein